MMALALALVMYSAAALYQLDLPGLHHDEAQEAGLMAMQLNEGLPVTLFRDTGFSFAGRTFPLMVQDYIGSLNVFGAWIAFAIAGVSVESLRVMAVLIGILTLMMTFGAARALAGWQAGSLTVILLAVHPTYIFWTRQGVFVTSYTLTIALASLWLLIRWWRGGRAWNLRLAAFLIGLGLWGKLLFVWYVGAVAIAWTALNLPRFIRRESLRPGVPTTLWSIPIAIFFGLAGLSPLISYNAQTGGTFDNIFNNLDQSYYGVDNSNVGQNFRERTSQARTVFESGHLREFGGLYRNPIAQPWMAFSIVGLALAVITKKEKRAERLFVLMLVALMVAQSSFTSTALWFTHFALILPFMVMLGAVGGLSWLDVMRHFRVDPRFQVLLAIPLLLLIAFEGITTIRYHDALTQTGGIATYSDAIYRLADELDALPAGHPVAAMDWGIGPSVEMLTEARIVPNEVFGYSAIESDPGFEARLMPFLALDDSLYVFHVPGQTVFPRRDAFFALVDSQGRDMTLITTIYDGSGNPYFEIWKAAR